MELGEYDVAVSMLERLDAEILVIRCSSDFRILKAGPFLQEWFGISPEKAVDLHVCKDLSWSASSRILLEEWLNTAKNGLDLSSTRHLGVSSVGFSMTVLCSLRTQSATAESPFFVELWCRALGSAHTRFHRGSQLLERYEQWMRKLELAVVDVDVTTGIMTCNRQASTLLGWVAEGQIFRLERWRKLFHPDDQMIFWNGILDLLAGRIHLFQKDLRNCAGAFRYSCFAWDHKIPHRLVITLQKIRLCEDSSSVEQEKPQLDSSLPSFSQIQEMLPLESWSVDLVDGQHASSDKFTRLHGEEALSGESVWEYMKRIINPDDLQALKQDMVAHVSGVGKGSRVVRVHPIQETARFFHISWRSWCKDGFLLRAQGVSQDVSGFYGNYWQMQERENASLQILDRLPDAILIFGRDLCLRDCNLTAERFTGIPKQMMLCTSIDQIFRLYGASYDMAAILKLRTLNWQILHQSGESFPVVIECSSLFLNREEQILMVVRNARPIH
ncbi:MAG TPA: hypothetical protein VLM37_03865, partial [Fibrobacteraceae bacterium]|nr:hypothetical protein [Fibrobacteraceae bacterium]